jgi:hypothetical protein
MIVVFLFDHAARGAQMTRRDLHRLLLAALLPCCLPSLAEAKLPPEAQRAADSYLLELARVEHSKDRVSMEPLFVLADSLDDAFFPSVLPYVPSSGPWTQEAIDNYSAHSVEGLPETEIDSLQTALRGIGLVLSDYVFTYVDTDFFLKVAESHGLPADVAFLKAYAGRDLGSESVQDCVHFGTNLIVNQHGAWVEYRARYPRDYVRFVAEEVQNVIGELMGTCACADSSSVERELEQFIRRFPEDPIAPQVRARLASVRNGTSGITFNCPPPHYH